MIYNDHKGDCDDGDPSTLDDTIDSNCDCVGSPTVYAQISTSNDDAEEEESPQKEEPQLQEWSHTILITINAFSITHFL